VNAASKKFIYSFLVCLLMIGFVFSFLYILKLRDVVRRAAFSSLQASRIMVLYQKSVDKKLAGLEKKEYAMLFVGDIMLSRSVAKKIYETNNTLFPFLLSADFLRSADITFGNLEGPMSSRGENQGSIYSFRADPSAVKGLVFAGFDILSLANNHIFDWGSVALNDTINLLKSNGIAPIGAGKNYTDANSPTFFYLGNTKVAFLAYTNLYPETLKADENTSGISDFDESRMERTARDVKQKADIVVVSFHWGDEYETRSNSKQQIMARKLIDSGADIVIGHHPHVTQEIEKYGNGWIAYSLGNFVFDQNFSEETMKSIAARATVQNKKITNFKSIPIQINSDFQPYSVGL